MQTDGKPLSLPSVHGVEFRPVAGFPGYCVGSDGSAWSCWGRGRRGRMGGVWFRLKPLPHPCGHLQVSLKNDRGWTRAYIHRLVAAAFLGPPPDGTEVCHNDGDPANNTPANLRYDTRKGNLADRVGHGTMNWGERQGHAKLTADVVREIRADYAAGGWTYRELGNRYGVDYSTVYAVVHRKTWRHIA